MLSGHEPSPARTEGPSPEPDGRREVGQCESIQNSLHGTIKSSWTGASEGSHERALIESEKRTFEIGELEQGGLDLQPSTRSPERRPILRMSDSHPRSSGVEEQPEDRHGASSGNLETDTPRDAGSGDVLHGPETAEEMENQSPPSSQPVTPSTLPLHLIPLLPQQSPSSKRQRDAAGGASPSPQSLRLRPQNFSAEPGAGISRTLAYAMDQMNATHSSDYPPLRDAELEERVITRDSEVEVDREGDAATRPKTVRFEESTRQPVELAERLWTNAVQAIAASARTGEGSEQKTEITTQSGEQGEGPTFEQDATVGVKNTEGGSGEREMPSKEDVRSFLRNLRAVTLGKAEEGQSKDATWAKAWSATEGGSRTVDLDAGSGAERTALSGQTLKPARLQEYSRLKEREVELSNAEAECRILEERLEAREEDLRNRLGIVGQRLEAVRQRRASINRQEEILRQKMEAVTKEAQASANLNALGADAPPESS